MCEERFSSYEAAIKHEKERHLNVAFVCEICLRLFKQYHRWDSHRKKYQVGTSSVSSIRSAPANTITSVRSNERSVSIDFDDNSLIGVAGPSSNLLSQPAPTNTIPSIQNNERTDSNVFDKDLLLSNSMEIRIHLQQLNSDDQRNKQAVNNEEHSDSGSIENSENELVMEIGNTNVTSTTKKRSAYTTRSKLNQNNKPTKGSASERKENSVEAEQNTAHDFFKNTCLVVKVSNNMIHCCQSKISGCHIRPSWQCDRKCGIEAGSFLCLSKRYNDFRDYHKKQNGQNGHYPTFAATRRSCSVCKRKAFIACIKCRKRFCKPDDRYCFYKVAHDDHNT